MYRQHGKQPKAEHRPLAEDFWRCTAVERHAEEFTDVVTDEICARWQTNRVLRELYLDPAVFAEYEAFRKKFIAAPTAEDTFHIVSPGFQPAIPMTQRHSNQSQLRCGRSFSSAFHKTLCLHSLAMAMRTLVIATNSSKALDDGTVDAALDAWDKSTVFIGHRRLELSIATRVRCLETWDFIYHFLLRKLFPPEILDQWVTACSTSFTSRGSESYDLKDFRSYFMDRLRWGLHPHDVVKAITTQAWTIDSTFVTDKHDFMMMRGTFETTVLDPDVWIEDFCRTPLVMQVEPTDRWHKWEEERLYWDDCRLQLGSPFHPDFKWGMLRAWRNLYATP